MAVRKESSQKKSVSKVGSGSGPSLSGVASAALKKLQSLEIEEKLQADIEWCLGSYEYDRNPRGLYVMLDKAVIVFQKVRNKDKKRVPPRLLKELETVLKERLL